MIKILIFIFLSIVWGTTWSAIKISLEGLSPLFGASLRFVVATAVLLIFALIRREDLRISRADYKWILWSALMIYLFDYGLIYWGEQYLNSGVTAIFFATYPLFVGVLATLRLENEPFRWNKFFGLLIGFGGVLLVFYDQLLVTEYHPQVVLACLAIIGAALATAISTIIIKKHLSGLRALPLTLHQMVWGVVLLTVAGLLRGEWGSVDFTPRVIAALIYLGAIASALAFVLYYYLLKIMSAVTLSYIIYITPMVAIFAGWVVLGEQVTIRALLGTVIIFAGIAVDQLGSRHARKRRSG